MNEFRALPGLLALAAFACALQVQAATVTTTLDSANSAKGITNSGCIQQLTIGVGDGENCMYDGGANTGGSIPTGESTGPLNSLEFYDYGTTPAAFDDPGNFLPTPNDGKIRQVISGTISVDDNGTPLVGTDDLISFNLTLTSPNVGGQIVRHLATGLSDKYTSMNQVLTSHPVDSATPNATTGGFDYVIGAPEGFPNLLVFTDPSANESAPGANDGPCVSQTFGDMDCDASFAINFCADPLRWTFYDDGDGGMPMWLPTDSSFYCGLPVPPGQPPLPHVGPPGSPGIGSMEGNVGARSTSASVSADFACEDGDGDPNTGDCTSSKVSFNPGLVGPDNTTTPGVTAEDVEWDQVYLKVSTDVFGNVLSAEGFQAQESQVFGAGVFCGNDPGAVIPTCNSYGAGHFTLAGDLPVAVDDDDLTIANTPVTVRVLANDVGFDDDVVVTLPGGGVSAELGTVVINGANPGPQGGIDITYTPFSGFTGEGASADTFEYIVAEEADGSADIATVRIEVFPPGANNDLATTSLNEPINIPVGLNDFGFADPVDVIITVVPDRSGNAVVNGSGGSAADVTVSYTPVAAIYSAPYTETFTYQVTDNNMASDTAIVTVTVENELPTAVDGTASAGESQDAITDVSTLTGVNLGDAPWTITATDGANGTITDITGTVITYTPTGFFTGDDSYDYTIMDKDGETDTATVSVTIGPKLVPTANPDSSQVDQGDSVQIDVTANDLAGSGSLAMHSVTISTPPANGSAVVGAANVVTYTPAASFSGNDSFQYTLTDADGDPSTTSVSVTVNPTDVTPPPGGGGPVGPELPSATALDVWSMALLLLLPWLRRRKAH